MWVLSCSEEPPGQIYLLGHEQQENPNSRPNQEEWLHSWTSSLHNTTVLPKTLRAGLFILCCSHTSSAQCLCSHKPKFGACWVSTGDPAEQMKKMEMKLISQDKVTSRASTDFIFHLPRDTSKDREGSLPGSLSLMKLKNKMGHIHSSIAYICRMSIKLWGHNAFIRHHLKGNILYCSLWKCVCDWQETLVPLIET